MTTTAHRRRLLLAMGIEQWLPREALPGAADGRIWQRRSPRPASSAKQAAAAAATARPAATGPGRVAGRQEPDAGTGITTPARTDGTDKQMPAATPQAQSLHYCAVLRGLDGGWLLLTEGDPVLHSPQARGILQDLIHALGLDSERIGEARRLDWPPAGSERLAEAAAMGRDALLAFLQAGLDQGSSRLLCVSSRLAELADGWQQQKMLRLPDLGDIVSSSEARRQAWQILGDCDERAS